MQYSFTLANGEIAADRIGQVANRPIQHISLSVPAGLTGTMAVEMRTSGSSHFETLEGTEFDLAAPTTLIVRGFIEELKFTVSGLTGAGEATVTVKGE